MNSKEITEQDWLKCYPDPLASVRSQLAPHRLVIDESVPDEMCIVVKWTDHEGEHVMRFLKEQHEVNPLLEKIQTAREEVREEMGRLTSIESLTRKPREVSFGDPIPKELDMAVRASLETLKKNFPEPGFFISVLKELGRGQLNRPRKHNVIIVTGPNCSGKSFIIKVIMDFLGDKCMELSDSCLHSLNGRHLLREHLYNEKLQLLVFREIRLSQGGVSLAFSYSREKPILLGMNEKIFSQIPPAERDMCIVLRCEREIPRDERNDYLTYSLGGLRIGYALRSWLMD